MTKDITKQKPQSTTEVNTEKERYLILHNDEIHSFDYVIDALITVCEHTEQQAAQCTLLTHYKGSCDVKKGSINELKPLRRALIEKELKATIN